MYVYIYMYIAQVCIYVESEKERISWVMERDSVWETNQSNTEKPFLQDHDAPLAFLEGHLMPEHWQSAGREKDGVEGL